MPFGTHFALAFWIFWSPLSKKLAALESEPAAQQLEAWTQRFLARRRSRRIFQQDHHSMGKTRELSAGERLGL